MTVASTRIGGRGEIGEIGEARGLREAGVEGGQQPFGQVARGREALGLRVARIGAGGERFRQPRDGGGWNELRRGRDAEVEAEADLLTREHLGDAPTRERGIGRRSLGEGGQTFLAVEDEHETALGGLEETRLDIVSHRFGLEKEEEFAPSDGLEDGQAGGIVLGRRFHRGDGGVERCVCHASASRTRRRRTGRSSASNHGFFLSHAVLRHDGWGRGRAVGMCARQLRTVSVTPVRVPRCHFWA